MNLAETIRENAERWPELPALVGDGRGFTYRELDEAVRAAAGFLRGAGIAPGDTVGVCLKETPQHVIAVFALGRIGAAFLPIDWRSKAEERQRMVGDFAPRAVLAEAGAKAFDSVRTIEITADWLDSLAAAPPDAEPAAPSGAIFMLSLSSGTTSTARAAEITHDQAQAFCLGFRVGSGFHHRARYLSVLPLSFAAGRDRLLLYLTSGGTVVLAPPLLSPEEVVARIVGHDIAATVMVPHLLRRLLEIAPEDGLLLPGLEFFESTGDKLAGAEKLEIVRRLSPNLYESYANSAVGLISCLRPADLAAHPDSVGRTNPLLEVEIIDDADRPLPAGEVGALRCRGPSLTQSGDHIDIRGGWLYPGDLGTIDGDGFLYLKGRATGLIKRRGTSIYPEEVESVLAAHPAVAEAAVVGRPAPDVGHDIVAYVATTGALSMAELRSYLIAELAGYKQPQEIVVLDRLPRTSSGKVNRGELTERAAKAGA